MDLANKTLIITGASSGIGRSAAILAAERGANLVLVARRADRLKETAHAARENGATVATVAGDVRKAETHRAAVERAKADFGGLDGAFNNAGTTGPASPLPELSPEDWHDVLDVNLTAAYHAARVQIPALREGGGGSIVFTSSFVGHGIGLPGMAAYAAAKAGLIGMTQVLAAEHGPEGIRVNALLPGGTRTEMAGSDAGFHEWVAGLHALKRMAEPEEIARAALFLLSDQASFVTGTALFADGGNSINKT